MGIEYFLEKKWLRSGCLIGRGGSSGIDTYDVGLGPFQNWTKSLHEGRPSWFLPSDFFRISQNDFFVPQSQFGCEKSAILEALPEAQEIIGAWEEPSESEFFSHFEQAMSGIESGQIKKVVPVVFEKMPMRLTEAQVAGLIRKGLEYDGRGYFYGHWDLDQGHAVFGFTPELLFDLDEYGNLETMALAGTAGSNDHDLLNDPKEMNEHKLVVDAILTRLKQYGEASASKTYAWKPSSLTHLRTDISAKVGTNSHFSLIADLHPTPALGGEPKYEAKDLLKKFARDIPRYQFGAPFGVVDDIGSARIIVQIRCLIFNSGQLYLGSGCGLVSGSEKQKEFAELKLKRNSVKSIFGLN